MPRTNVYIDGFNFYYGCLKNTPYKWLDVARLGDVILSGHQIQHVHFFTARVNPRGRDHGQPNRQDAYLRAIAHDPRVVIHEGHFSPHVTHMPRANGKGLVRVVKTEEKGSDVNLAVQLVADALLGDCDCGVVVSNDSDLASAMRVARETAACTVGLINPHRRRASKSLVRYAHFVRDVRMSTLERCQLPPEVSSPTGRVHKPARW